MAESRQVKKALRGLGFRPVDGTGGHEIWENDRGRRVTPVFRHKELTSGSFFALTQQLEGFGICKRSDFKRTVQAV